MTCLLVSLLRCSKPEGKLDEVEGSRDWENHADEA